jgi:hypothetical protein
MEGYLFNKGVEYLEKCLQSYRRVLGGSPRVIIVPQRDNQRQHFEETLS